MSVQVEKLEKNMAKLTVEVPADEVEKAFDFLNLMTSDDYRNDSFKELLENHRNYVDDENMSKKIGNDLDALADYKRKKLVISGVKKKSNSK